MDEQLAAIYGTNQDTEYYAEDQEKLAAAEMLVKLAEEEGVDLNQFSDHEIAEMVNDIYAGQDEVDDSQEKVAEADFLGRVMAHAYVQELGAIEKTAAKEEMIGPKISPVRRGYRNALDNISEWTGVKGIKGGREGMREAAEETKKIQGMAVPSSMKVKTEEALKNLAFKSEAGKKQFHAGLKRLGLRVGAPLAATGATAALVHHLRKEKRSSVDLDKLAESRAIEMLYDQGWIDEEGNLLYAPQEKVASVNDVEVRALQMLEENGFPVNWA